MQLQSVENYATHVILLATLMSMPACAPINRTAPPNLLSTKKGSVLPSPISNFLAKARGPAVPMGSVSCTWVGTSKGA